MSNSPLVNYVQLSPCKTENRNHVIDSIVIHCSVGQVSVERMGKGWANLSADASANYGIGSDGRIGLYVEEKDRAWTTGGKYSVNGISGSQYDHRAVTIECACDTTAPYAINDKVMESLIELCTDICERNKIPELRWKGDKTLVGRTDLQNMVVHRWFAAKSCPGDYIYNRLSYIAAEVNKRLGVKDNKSNIIYHTVAKNESLSKIGNAYGVPYQQIARDNGISNPNLIRVGQVLKINVEGLKVAPTTYTVVSGDYLGKIAKNTGVPLATLKKLNPEVKAPLFIIRPGQVLKLK